MKLEIPADTVPIYHRMQNKIIVTEKYRDGNLTKNRN
jgi:hypothetical protein